MTINGSSTIPIYSPARGRHLGSATVGGAPHDLAFTPGGRQLWLSNFSSGLLTIDPPVRADRLAGSRWQRAALDLRIVRAPGSRR